LSVLSAGLAAISNDINPLSDYSSQLNAAKGFTILEQDARALRDTGTPSRAFQDQCLKPLGHPSGVVRS
jgi:hypothetical protein